MSRYWDAEVVVLGCGIAGLLLASELSKQVSVIALEKSPRIPTHKYWLTSKESLEPVPEFKEAVSCYLGSLRFISHDEREVAVDGSFPLWNTRALVNRLSDIIQANDARILTDSRFYNYFYDGNRVIVQAEDFSIRTHLIVDAMGYESPIAAANSTLHIAGYYLVHGNMIEIRSQFEPIAFYNMAVDKHPKYVEAFPMPNGLAHVALIVPSRAITQYYSIANDFKYLTERSHLKGLLSTANTQKSLYRGIIPIGRRRKCALNRIFFFGESGQSNPAASGAALTRMLLSYKSVAQRLVECVRRNRLTSSYLSPISELAMTRFNRRAHLNFFEELLRMNSPDFSRFLIELEEFDDETIINMVFGSLNTTDVFKIRHVRRLLSKRRGRIIRSALRALFPTG